MTQLRKVQRGQRMRIPAETFNTIIDAAQDYLQRKQEQGGEGSRSFGPAADVIFIRNDSGVDLARFAILGIDSILFDPGVSEDAFINQIAVSGIAPVSGTHEGRFAVLLEPIADGKLGRAAVGGIVPVKVYVSDEDHGYAEIGGGDASQLYSTFGSSATILWAEGGTGTQWALVRLSRPGGRALVVIVTDDTNKATGDYMVKQWGELYGERGTAFAARGMPNSYANGEAAFAIVDADGICQLLRDPYAVWK